MNPLAYLAAHGGVLLLGVTIVLAGGVLAVLLQRQVAQRRRLGIWTALGCAVYLAVAAAPLPRGTLPWPVSAADPVAPVPAPRDAGLALDSTVAFLPADVRGEAALRQLEEELALLGERAERAERAASAERVAAASTRAAWSWAEGLAAAWLAGFLIASVRLCAGALAVRRLVARASAPPPWLATAVALPPRARLRIADEPVRPFCVGLLRPAIVLPSDLARQQRQAQATAVLRHEAAHLRAGDTAVQVLFAVLSAALFFHPLFFWLRREVRFASELLADDAAARTAGAPAYARQLLDLAERAHPMIARAGAVSVFHRPSEFYRRIHMLLLREGHLSTSTPRGKRAVSALALASLVAVTGAFLGAPAAAQEPEGRDLRRQNEALRATIDELQQEIAALRAAVDQTKRVLEVTLSPAAEPPRSLETVLDRSAAAELVLGNLFRAGADGLPSELVPAPDESSSPAADDLAESLLGRILGDPEMSMRLRENLGLPAERTATQDPLRPTEKAHGRIFPSEQSGPFTMTTVREGDTLEGIARRVGLPREGGVDMLRRTNPSVDPEQLRIGQQLFVPPVATGYPPTPLQPQPPETSSGGSAGAARAVAEIVTRFIDLQGEVELAEGQLADNEEHAKAGIVSTRDVRESRVRLQTAVKKLAIVDRLIRGEIEATGAEIEALKAQRERGEGDAGRIDVDLRRARLRLETLQSAQ